MRQPLQHLWIDRDRRGGGGAGARHRRRRGRSRLRHAGRHGQIVDEGGKALPAGREGSVRIRTAQTVTGYVGNPAEAETAFRDGWFYPGDIGSLRDDRLLLILGRERRSSTSAATRSVPAWSRTC